MDLRNVNLTTLIPEFPTIYNYNNREFKRYLDVIYDEDQGVIVVPVNTTGRVKAASAEFVNAVVDNLTVKSQYTNLYENITTANYDYYVAYTGVAATVRNASTAAWENNAYQYIDVEKPYYKITPDVCIGLANDNISQVVQLVLDPSGDTSGTYRILIDPDPLAATPYLDITFDASMLALGTETKWVSFICTEHDASYGSTWSVYEFGDGAAGSGTGSTGVTSTYVNNQIAAGLEPYATNASVNTALGDYATTSYIDTSLAFFVKGTSINGTTNYLPYWDGEKYLDSSIKVELSTGWDPSQFIEDKAFLANATNINELANVLATLINELKEKGILGA